MLTVHPVVASAWTGNPVIMGQDRPEEEHARQAAKEATAKVTSELGLISSRPPVTVRAVSGFVVQELIDASKDADLLVVGSRGGGGFAALALGSVTTQGGGPRRQPRRGRAHSPLDRPDAGPARPSRMIMIYPTCPLARSLTRARGHRSFCPPDSASRPGPLPGNPARMTHPPGSVRSLLSKKWTRTGPGEVASRFRYSAAPSEAGRPLAPAAPG